MTKQYYVVMMNDMMLRGFESMQDADTYMCNTKLEWKRTNPVINIPYIYIEPLLVEMKS